MSCTYDYVWVFDMRASRVCLAASGLMLVIWPSSLRSDEIYYCEDGTSLRVTADNRACKRETACVRAWFANDAALRARNAKTRGGRPADLPESQRALTPPTDPKVCTDTSPGEGATRPGAPLSSVSTVTDVGETEAQSFASPNTIISPRARAYRQRTELDYRARTVHVRAYTRSDGTQVRAHTRSPPRSR